MTEDDELYGGDLVNMADKVTKYIEEKGSISKGTVKRWFPVDYKEVVTFGVDNKMFQVEGRKLVPLFVPRLKEFDDTERQQRIKEQFSADVEIDEIEPLVEEIKLPEVQRILAMQTELLDTMLKMVGEISLTLKNTMGYIHTESRMEKRMNDLEANFRDLKQAMSVSYQATGPEVTQPTTMTPEPQEDPFLVDVRKALGNATELVRYGYKAETGNYWISLNKQNRNISIFTEIQGRLKGLGFQPIMKDFFFIKKTRSKA